MIWRVWLVGLLLTSAMSPALFAREPGYHFLRVGVSPRATSLGDAFTSSFGDVTTFMYNPAGVAVMETRQASAGYMNHLLDIQSGFLAYVQPIGEYGMFGAGLVYFNYGDFQGYDAFANETKDFSAGDVALNFFHAHSAFDNAYYGVNLKFIHSTIEDYSSTAIAIDLGMIYRIADQDAQVGISLLNVGQVTDAFARTKDDLPLSLQIGFSKKLEKAPITVSGNFSDLNLAGSIGDRLKRFAVGAELSPREYLFVRAGYNHQRHNDLNLDSDEFMNRIAGFSAGLGFKYRQYTFDYSFASWGIGAINRLSLTMSFP